jgi:hypothetical protein
MSNALAASLVLLLSGPHVPAMPDETVAVSDEVLATQRGGFKLPNGLEITFGVSRQVFANDLPILDLELGMDVALVLQNTLDAQQLRVVTTYDIRVLGLQSLDTATLEQPSGLPDFAIPW